MPGGLDPILVPSRHASGRSELGYEPLPRSPLAPMHPPSRQPSYGPPSRQPSQGATGLSGTLLSPMHHAAHGAYGELRPRSPLGRETPTRGESLYEACLRKRSFNEIA